MDKLVKKAQNGDAEAFITLMEQNKQTMKRIAIAYLGNEEDVADAIQETILDAFEKKCTLKKPEFFKTWLIRILINNCITIQRKKAKVISMDLVEADQQTKLNLETFHIVQNSDLEFFDLLQKLPKESRIIFQMYYGEQFTTKEIAKLLHLKESTVKSRIHRGKEQLRTQLDI